MSLAARLTESPSTEYSRLDPLVPTTPAKTVPVAIPIEHGHLIFYSSRDILKAVKIALVASSW